MSSTRQVYGMSGVSTNLTSCSLAYAHAACEDICGFAYGGVGHAAQDPHLMEVSDSDRPVRKTRGADGPALSPYQRHRTQPPRSYPAASDLRRTLTHMIFWAIAIALFTIGVVLITLAVRDHQ